MPARFYLFFMELAGIFVGVLCRRATMEVNMSRLKLQPAPPLASGSPYPEGGRRLIVLVPALELEPVLAARRLCELAEAAHAHILFLGICSDAVQEPGLRRQLILLSAMVTGGGVPAHTELAIGKGWLEALRSRRGPGDLLVCFAEHRVGALGRPIGQLLQSALDAPLYILSGMDGQGRGHSSRLTSALAWLGVLAILAGVFFLQVRIGDLSQGWAQTALMLISLGAGAGAIWLWNSWFD